MKRMGKAITLGVLRLRVPEGWDAPLRMTILWRDEEQRLCVLSPGFVALWFFDICLSIKSHARECEAEIWQRLGGEV